MNNAILANIDWGQHHAAIWYPYSEKFYPITTFDTISTDSLLGINAQKQQLIENTVSLLQGDSTAQHVLLRGSRGCGKSSLIRAVFDCYRHEGLRLIQLDSANLHIIPEVCWAIRSLQYHFILYCDDLAFDTDKNAYRFLKTALEGSIQPAPINMRMYVTTNRKHIVAEPSSDNADVTVTTTGEIHYRDSVEERISLADRFGLWLTFYPWSQQQYLHVTQGMSTRANIPWGEEQAADALRYAQQRGVKNGRTAQLWFNTIQYSTVQNKS